MQNSFTAALAIGALSFFSAAEAASIVSSTDPQVINSFVSFGDKNPDGSSAPGVEGVELRGGRAGARDWEIGLGDQTSTPGRFNQAEFTWTETAAGQSFVYEVTAAGVATLTISNVGNSETVSWTTPGLNLGNAIEIFAKREAEITITEINDVAFNFNVGDITIDNQETLVLISDDFLNGFKLEGTLGMLNGNGSRYGINIKAGNVNPVPVPAAGILFGAVLAAGATRKLRKRTA